MTYIDDYNYSERRHDRPKHRPVVISSSTGGVGPLPIITTLFAAPLNVVSTSTDTTGMLNSINLLQFNGIVNLPLGISVTLNFEILRSYDDGSAVKVGPTFTFSTLVDVLEAEAFSFQFADDNMRGGSYTYSVQLSTNSIIDITPGAAVVNATLSIISAEK